MHVLYMRLFFSPAGFVWIFWPASACDSLPFNLVFVCVCVINNFLKVKQRPPLLLGSQIFEVFSSLFFIFTASECFVCSRNSKEAEAWADRLMSTLELSGWWRRRFSVYISLFFTFLIHYSNVALTFVLFCFSFHSLPTHTFHFFTFSFPFYVVLSYFLSLSFNFRSFLFFFPVIPFILFLWLIHT